MTSTVGEKGGVNGAPATLEEAFEPAATKLATIWMAITDVGCGLRRVVDETAPQKLGDHAKTLQHELKRMDELVFSSIEVMDDLFTLVREDLAGRADRANGVLPVNALDAYLDGVTKLPPVTVNRGVQTDHLVNGAAVVTLSPSPMAVHHKLAQMASIKMFDLLRGLHRQRDVKPKLEIKKDSTASHGGKKRIRSPVSTEMEGDHNNKKREYHRTPKKVIQDRRPIAVHGVREHLSQREYAIEFEGLDEDVWIVARRAPPAAKSMIQAYAKSLRKKRHREKLKASAVAATRSNSVDGDGDDTGSEMDADGIYIVEKIVDHRFRYGKKQYFVKWDGYDTDENTWEPAAKLRFEVRSIVDDYERDLAKAVGQKAGEDATSKTALSKAIGVKSSSSGLGKTKPVAFGRPSNPSALTKCVPANGSAELLQRSGKIPKVQFQINEIETDDDYELEDSDLERLAGSDDEDDEDDEEIVNVGRGRFGAKRYGYKGHSLGKQRRTKKLSPQIE